LIKAGQVCRLAPKNLFSAEKPFKTEKSSGLQKWLLYLAQPRPAKIYYFLRVNVGIFRLRPIILLRSMYGIFSPSPKRLVFRRFLPFPRCALLAMRLQKVKN
jgi:hypothetical protein